MMSLFICIPPYNLWLQGLFFHDFSAFSGKEFCLYPFLLALFSSLFGLSFESGRLFSVCLGGFSLGFVYFLCRQLRWPLWLQSLCLLCVLSLNTFFVSFRLIRPESLLLFLMVITCYLLTQFCTYASSKKWTLIGLGGVCPHFV